MNSFEMTNKVLSAAKQASYNGIKYIPIDAYEWSHAISCAKKGYLIANEYGEYDLTVTGERWLMLKAFS